MNKYMKVLVATGVSAGLLLGGVTLSDVTDQTAQAAKEESQKPYYNYKGTFNHKENDALKDKYFYQALAADNFKYEGLKVGQSTKADMDKVLGKNVKMIGTEAGISYYETNDVILGFDNNQKLVDLVLKVEKIKDSQKDIQEHVDRQEFYDADTTQVAFFPDEVIAITAKDRVVTE
ncbi:MULTISPECIES: hypothetical protein [unclassified Staphylococcus]|uniref:immunodominant staphylococcal antigen IsaB family protein n=1 Tax=unclassified Staphylococcus TaxID=91994 RepID=UPI0021D253AF|nr:MULTISPECIES: hypothetical protein [unclassified Staphylococcus]UXR69532.1 hypothetical protein MUA26_10520 [Staphylococcus sp. IVB6246]UXR71586.1 hypothetical protein MUA88_10525 [Staphylococcus sp. IVB6240]UXR73862.1 hypothetical protein MUA48_11035 [Staphylococcus sp. IVB6238]UXR76183.1 hypothetical protein MUA74_11135 [Staphylococcus sp. IVB6233]UXR80380.1 hypothetical protein MUA65_10740 [Staphylococcus sp. IVB6218]